MIKVAIPVSGGQFSAHFGAADEFAIFTADPAGSAITSREVADPPRHERGVFPAWLRSQGVTAILAGGMGVRASSMFEAYGIEVVMGLEGGSPEELAQAYLEGRLTSSGSLCQGGGYHDCGHHHDAGVQLPGREKS